MARSLKSPTCSTCPYWVPVPTGDENVAPTQGRCREGPRAGPVIEATAEGPRLALPLMAADEWCGRHPDHPTRRRLTEK